MHGGKDQDVGGGVGGVDRRVGGVATAVCVRGGFEVRCMGVRRRKIRRILTTLREVEQSCR